MEKIWEVNDEHLYTDEQIAFLQAKLNNYCNSTIANMLARRIAIDIDKLQNPATAESELARIRLFLRPSLDALHDPFLYLDMDKAVARLSKAIDSGENIMIYGDYDVDGTTSVALVYSFLHKYCTQNISFYIPNRYSEGYGVSFMGIDTAVERGCGLIIALDCGIKDNPRIEYAATKGIDFIVCDHHNPGEELPKAYAVLDAKRPDNTYPYNELSGCGVGFKLLQALCISRNIAIENLYEFLDLVAVSIISDIVPMTGENRILAYFGLKKINEDPMTCIAAIKTDAGLAEKNITVEDALFAIGPRINAAGRMRSGMDAVKLLICNDFNEACSFAREISRCNDDRKETDRNITESALAMLEADPDNSHKTSTVVCGDEWHKGVVGIVASRLTETYYRPTIVLSRNGDMLTGSARSVSDFNLYDAIDSCRQYLTAFGGHKFAAGLSMKAEVYDDFRREFEEYVSRHIQEHQKHPSITIERYITFDEITDDFYQKLQEFQPYGPENPEPIFATRGVVNYGKTRAVGKESPQKHLRLEVIDSSQAKMVGIGFGLAAFADILKAGKAVDICYTVAQNVFNGKTSLQLMVKDIKMG
ncbi:MAG: single-stranded-DNA-specific exonuclease RecJ [Bacteroidales bacterium]|nr:single-stranded-DNA-specific exonuclease RecJ [Bacteroidales bacterium]